MNADSTTRPSVSSTVHHGLPQLLACVLLLMLIPAAVIAEGGLPDGWISFDGVTATPTAPRVQIISSSSSRIRLIISTPGMLCETIGQPPDGAETAAPADSLDVEPQTHMLTSIAAVYAPGMTCAQKDIVATLDQ